MREEVRYFSTENQNYPFCIELSGISYCDGTYRIERKNSECFVFEYIIRGTGTVISDSSAYRPSAGDVYILHRGSDHLYYSDAENPWTKIWFNVYGSLVEKLLEAYGLEHTVYIRGCDLQAQFERFYRTALQRRPVEEVFASCALVFHEIVAAAAREVHSVRPDYSPEVLALKQYLDQNIGKKIAIEELARLVYRSQSQTIRMFKSEVHETPYAYHLRRKMETAESLLRGTKMPVKEIARSLGFSDQHYFSNLFKQRTGKSPLLYRGS